MDRVQVAEALEEIGLLLELVGENPFKIRAYVNGARIVRSLEGDLATLARGKALTAVRGIGPALASKIAVLVAGEPLPLLDELRAKVPSGLLDWLRVPGLGAKKARSIHVTLGISTLDELEAACRAGQVREIAGFGATSEKKILDGIARLRVQAERFLAPVAREAAERLLSRVRAVDGVGAAEIAGSVRRRLETSKDIDIVVGAIDAGPVMDAFVGDPAVVELTGRGPTRCSVRLDSGLAADLRVVEPDQFPFAWLYFTGSKAHNIALRARAQRRGLKLNEYALIRDADGTVFPCVDEAAIYRELGLAWIAPELREDLGEFEAAEAGRLPRLIEAGDLRGLLHVHSNWSDGSDSIRDLALAAIAAGYEYLAICDHSHAARYANGLDEDRLAAQREEIAAVQREIGGALRLLAGIEVDILADGALDLPEATLAGLDLVVASIHSRFELDTTAQTARVLRALAHPCIDLLGHPTGRLLLQRDAYAIDLDQVLVAAAKHQVTLELNCHPQRLDLDWRELRRACQSGIKTAINPDAHTIDGFSDTKWGVAAARKAWCTPEDVVNAWPVERLLAHLRSARSTRARPGGSSEEEDRDRPTRAPRGRRKPANSGRPRSR